MTVQELINKLQAISDKSLPVRYYDGEYDSDWDIHTISLRRNGFGYDSGGYPEGEEFYRIQCE